MAHSKSLEVEYRALLTKDSHAALLARLSADPQVEDLGADDKRVWFFLLPDKLLKVTHNISRDSAKVTLKLARIGQGSTFEEIEYPIAPQVVPDAIRLFTALGHEPLIEPIIRRHDYRLNGVEIAVKYSKSWGYHAELEILISRPEDQGTAERAIREVAKTLGLTLMTEEELTEFTRAIETNYVTPSETELAAL